MRLKQKETYEKQINFSKSLCDNRVTQVHVKMNPGSLPLWVQCKKNF